MTSVTGRRDVCSHMKQSCAWTDGWMDVYSNKQLDACVKEQRWMNGQKQATPLTRILSVRLYCSLIICYSGEDDFPLASCADKAGFYQQHIMLNFFSGSE